MASLLAISFAEDVSISSSGGKGERMVKYVVKYYCCPKHMMFESYGGLLQCGKKVDLNSLIVYVIKS